MKKELTETERKYAQAFRNILGPTFGVRAVKNNQDQLCLTISAKVQDQILIASSDLQFFEDNQRHAQADVYHKLNNLLIKSIENAESIEKIIDLLESNQKSLFT